MAVVIEVLVDGEIEVLDVSIEVVDTSVSLSLFFEEDEVDDMTAIGVPSG